MTIHAIALLAAFASSAGFQSATDGLARERGGASDAAKNALEGKAPPIKLEMSAWSNAPEKAPTWESLKGKVILLDFWAHW